MEQKNQTETKLPIFRKLLSENLSFFKLSVLRQNVYNLIYALEKITSKEEKHFSKRKIFRTSIIKT